MLRELLADPPSVLARLEAARARPGGDRTLVARAEAEVRRDPGRAIQLDAGGFATVTAAGRAFAGGRFEVVELGELEARVRARGPGGAPVRLSVLQGYHPAVDIGALQGAAGPGCCFQVASQFNCLEAPGPFLADIAEYLHDSTQGPRASISALPGILVRHHAAPGPGGERFVQRRDRQLDLLSKVAPGLVRNGYLTTADVPDAPALAAQLEAGLPRLQVGVHQDVEVVFGYDWLGAVEGPPAPRIAQVFTSTLALGGNSRGPVTGAHRAIARQLLRGAYLGTLLAAASLGAREVLLALIGGGVFGNPPALIEASLLWALRQAAPLLPEPLEVVVNGHWKGVEDASGELMAEVRRTGGVLLQLDPPPGWRP